MRAAAAGHALEVCKPESGVMAVCVYIQLVMGKGCWVQHLLCFALLCFAFGWGKKPKVVGCAMGTCKYSPLEKQLWKFWHF